MPVNRPKPKPKVFPLVNWLTHDEVDAPLFASVNDRITRKRKGLRKKTTYDLVRG